MRASRGVFKAGSPRMALKTGLKSVGSRSMYKLRGKSTHHNAIMESEPPVARCRAVGCISTERQEEV